RARRILEDALAANPLEARQLRILHFVLNTEALALAGLGDLAGARTIQAGLLELAEESLRRDPRDRWSQMSVSIAARHLAEYGRRAGDAEGALRRSRRALEISRRAAAEDPAFHYARMEEAANENAVARALLARPTRSGSLEACAELKRAQSFWAGLQS